MTVMTQLPYPYEKAKVIALEESAHAIAALELGYAVERLSILPDPGGTEGVCVHRMTVTHSADRTQADPREKITKLWEDDVIIKIAGVAAVYRTTEEEQMDRAADGEMQRALDLAKVVSEGTGAYPEAVVERAMTRAKEIQVSNAAAWERLVNPLLEHGELSSEQVQRIVEELRAGTLGDRYARPLQLRSFDPDSGGDMPGAHSPSDGVR
jgi:ATP-dependent Zn protease